MAASRPGRRRAGLTFAVAGVLLAAGCSSRSTATSGAGVPGGTVPAVGTSCAQAFNAAALSDAIGFHQRLQLVPAGDGDKEFVNGVGRTITCGYAGVDGTIPPFTVQWNEFPGVADARGNVNELAVGAHQEQVTPVAGAELTVTDNLSHSCAVLYHTSWVAKVTFDSGDLPAKECAGAAYVMATFAR